MKNGHRKTKASEIERLAWQNSMLRLALGDMCRYVRRVGGWMSAGDQELLRNAERVLKASESW